MKLNNEDISNNDYNSTRVRLIGAKEKIERALKYGPDMRSSMMLLVRELEADLISIRISVDFNLYDKN